jgi:hypothetical protein
MRTSLGLMAAILCVCATGAGCTTPAEGKAMEGLAAFKSCDLRAASTAFDAAYKLDSTRADFALAYALSTLAVLAEDPAVTAILERLGFGGPVDTSIVWGPGGALDQLAAHNAKCGTLWDSVVAKIPYAAV